jgi:hypothetical protein
MTERQSLAVSTEVSSNGMPPELEQLLSASAAILAVVCLILLIRALLGVNTTHSKLDEILRELRKIKSEKPGRHDPSPRGSEDTSGDERED